MIRAVLLASATETRRERIDALFDIPQTQLADLLPWNWQPAKGTRKLAA